MLAESAEPGVSRLSLLRCELKECRISRGFSPVLENVADYTVWVRTDRILIIAPDVALFAYPSTEALVPRAYHNMGLTLAPRSYGASKAALRFERGAPEIGKILAVIE